MLNTSVNVLRDRGRLGEETDCCPLPLCFITLIIIANAYDYECSQHMYVWGVCLVPLPAPPPHPTLHAPLTHTLTKEPMKKTYESLDLKKKKKKKKRKGKRLKKGRTKKVCMQLRFK